MKRYKKIFNEGGWSGPPGYKNMYDHIIATKEDVIKGLKQFRDGRILASSPRDKETEYMNIGFSDYSKYKKALKYFGNEDYFVGKDNEDQSLSIVVYK